MAEYYGKLKDVESLRGGKKGKKIAFAIIAVVLIIVVIAVLVGIFGDTKRRDKTRELVIENSELKQQVFELMEEKEALEREVENLTNTLEQNSLDVGTTLLKPNGDMSENPVEDFGVPHTEEGFADPQAEMPPEGEFPEEYMPEE